MSVRHKLIFGLAAVCWSVVAWIHLYQFSLPGMDTWCYFAPSVAAPAPFHLVQPLLGTFGGADQTWGLHWPGTLLINSALFAGKSDFAAFAAAWMVFLWLACAAGLSYLAWKVSRLPGFALFVFLLLLADRSSLIVGGYQRMELMALAVVSGLASILVARAREEEIGFLARTAELVAMFLCPILHPLAAFFAGGVLVAGFWLARKRRPWTAILARAACFLAGGMALIGWFLLQPEAVAQFRDHAKSAADLPFSRGSIAYAMWFIYHPLYTGLLVYVPGLLGALWGLRFLRAGFVRPPFERSVLLPFSVIAWGMFIAMHLMRNPLYILLLLPPVVAVTAEFARVLALRRPAWMQSGLVTAAAVAIVGVHGAFWVTRSVKWWQAGRPSFRAELSAFWRSLPADAQVFVPEVLWEQAVGDRARALPTRANTLPYYTTDERRERYERYCYADVKPGAILIVNRFQARNILGGIDPRRWRYSRAASFLVPGSTGAWGYDFTIYTYEGEGAAPPAGAAVVPLGEGAADAPCRLLNVGQSKAVDPRWPADDCRDG